MKTFLPGYNVKKAAQVAAFFIIKEGGKINILKLTKLIYLSDRSFLERYDSPILYDRLVSMPFGPVNSITYNYTSGGLEDPDWDACISDREGHNLGLASPFTVTDLDELSRAELEVLESVWSAYGHMDRFEISDFTHEHCKEWVDPEGSSQPIHYKTLLEFLGKKDCAMLAQAIEEERSVKTAWA